MPVVSFVSQKGGAGKTTSCIILASELVHNGAKVTVIDADPAARLCRWRDKAPLPEALKVIKCSEEGRVLDELEAGRERSDFVLFDTEGVASRINTMIALNSDLVVVPMGDEQQDAEDAIESLTQLKTDGRIVGKEVPARILFSKVKAAVKASFEKDINKEMRENVRTFKTELVSRAAYKQVHRDGGILRDITSGAGRLDKALENAEQFAAEVLDILREEK